MGRSGDEFSGGIHRDCSCGRDDAGMGLDNSAIPNLCPPLNLHGMIGEYGPVMVNGYFRGHARQLRGMVNGMSHGIIDNTRNNPRMDESLLVNTPRRGHPASIDSLGISPEAYGKPFRNPRIPPADITNIVLPL